MFKKEMIAMLLAGGQGSRLGVLTQNTAKPAVSFGGKYSIIDFTLSNCINSGVDTVGVLTQYQPLKLNSHIGIGMPWDLDRRSGGVSILPPHETIEGSAFYSGTANAIYQNINYIDSYDPDYVLILSGDHIYKMDYKIMLDYHKACSADVTIACRPVPWEEASRFGLVLKDESGRITGFEEKPENPSSNMASMGIYIFTWKRLKEVLLELKDQPGCDFGMHVIPYCMEHGSRIYAYEFNDYWKDVGTLRSYWDANMELVEIVPVFNLYEKYWKIYTRIERMEGQYMGPEAHVERSLLSEGCEIYGEVTGSVLGAGVVVGPGCVVRDSIIMADTILEEGCRVDKAIIGERCTLGKNCILGDGAYAPSQLDERVYQSELATVAEDSVIPPGVIVGRNTAISGETVPEDYPEGRLPSGGYIIREAEL